MRHPDDHLVLQEQPIVTSEPSTDAKRYVQSWQLQVHREHGQSRRRAVDTIITLFKPRDGVGPWIIRKWLDEQPDTLAALAVADEKSKLLKIMTIGGLPCAELVPWEGVLGGTDPNIIYTRYAGPCTEMHLRHPLSDHEYASLLAWQWRVGGLYVRAGVVLFDTADRNWCAALSEGERGEILFSTMSAIDHRFDIIVGQARHAPWPFLRFDSATAPEVERLLALDRERPLKDMAPTCPVDNWRDLASLPVVQRYQIMSQLRSPALGGAIDDGLLDIEKAHQSMTAFRLKALMVAAPSRRPHAKALAFLNSRRHVLDRMNAPNPDDRYPSLDAAAAALLGGWPLLQRSVTRIQLTPPGPKPVEGASQPDTDPPGAEGSPLWRPFGDDGLRLFADDIGNMAQVSNATDDAAFGEELDPRWTAAQAWAQQRWRERRPLRVVSYALAGCLCLGFVAWHGVVQTPTAALIVQAEELERLDEAAGVLATANDAATQELRVAQILALVQNTANAHVKQRAAFLLGRHWQRVMRNLSVRLDGSATLPKTQRVHAMVLVKAWAKAGYPAACELGRVTRSTP